MNLNESDTRAKLIDPVLHKNGWAEDFIRREISEALASLRTWHGINLCLFAMPSDNRFEELVNLEKS